MEIPGSELVTVRGLHHHDIVMDRLWGLVQGRQKVDFGFASCNGLLWAHHLILGLFFEPQQLLQIEPQNWEGISLELLIEFAYRGTVSVPEDQLVTFLELAKQLKFTLLVDALLSAQKRIQVVKSSTTYPGARTRDFRIGDIDIFPCGNDPAALPSATLSATNSAQVVVPVLPNTNDDGGVRAQSIAKKPIRSQHNVGDRITADAEVEPEWNVHLSSVSVSIEEEACSEMNLESFKPKCEQVEESGASNAVGVVKIEPSGDVDTYNRQSPVNELSKRLEDAAGSGKSRVSSKRTNSDNGVVVGDASSANRKEGSKPDKLDGTYEASRPSGDLKVVLKKYKRDSGDTAATNSDQKTTNAVDEKRFKCGFCQRAFKRRDHMIAHCRIHTGEKPFKCEVCQMEFSFISNFADHKRRHTGEKLYKCYVCEKAFIKSGDLNRHVKIHTAEKPYQCLLCSKSYKRLDNLQTHARIHSVEMLYGGEVDFLSLAKASQLSEPVVTEDG